MLLKLTPEQVTMYSSLRPSCARPPHTSVKRLAAASGVAGMCSAEGDVSTLALTQFLVRWSRNAALRTATRLAAAGGVPEDTASALFSELVQQMRKVQATPALLHDVVKAAAQLARSVPSLAGGASGKEWSAGVLEACDKKMAPVVATRLKGQASTGSASQDVSLDDSAAAASSPSSCNTAEHPPGAGGSQDDAAKLIPAVFLVGALALEGVKIPTRLCNAVQALLKPVSVGSS